MTGELCDCFETKRLGVSHILQAVETAIGPCAIWRIDGRFATASDALSEPLLCAASNWLALATYCSRFATFGSALLLDIGSTTTDIVPLLEGIPIPQGRTDWERLRYQELIYTGVFRTPLCALLGWNGMAEFFATTKDVYILLGDIPENQNSVDTADGRPATKEFAYARLARMIGGDAESVALNEAIELAAKAKQLQVARIRTAIQSKLQNGPVIMSGSGEFLGRAVLAPMDSIRPISLAAQIGNASSAAACAVAVASLLAEGRHGP
jgi:probable H4MPT-linked C1 transfer pathway protein